MGARRWLADFRELRAAVAELTAHDEDAEEQASFDLTAATTRFTRNTRRVVDDKLSFTATLMRAGEVSGANRLMEEVEQEVRSEEAALAETVNEVKFAMAARRERITRLRLVRTLAAATLGAGLLSFSAIGISLASLLKDAATPSEAAQWGSIAASAARGDDASDLAGKGLRAVRRIRIGDHTVALNASQLRAFMQVASGTISQSALEELLSTLPDAVVAEVEEVLRAATDVKAEAPVEETLTQIQAQVRKKAKQAAKEAQRDEQPKEEETPAPDESNGDNSDQGEEGEDPEDSSEPDDWPLDL